MLAALFWLSLLLLFYIYFGYPLLVKAMASLCSMAIRVGADHQPRVSILIAAYNEAKDIEATLRNKVDLDYPADKLEVLVISDESDDGTDDIVQRVAAESRIPIRLFRQEPRQGKTSGLNTLVPEAAGDIILFSDANSQWDIRAVSKLCRNFADADVGYVTGKMVYVNKDGSLVGDGCSAYMKYENWLRKQETRIGSVVGVDGGIDAMRKSLYQLLKADQLPDFVQPLKVVEQGYRVVYEPEALLKEEALSDSNSEFSMRVRVSLRALWALKDMKHLMNPLRDPVFAWQLVSHKLLRYIAFVPLVTLALSTLLLARSHGIYMLAFLSLIVFVGLAWTGHKREGQGQPLSVIYSIPYYFLLLNIASYKAVGAFLKGEKKVIWNPRKG
ncbi:glycosyltransferase family 2 protein [Marinobacter pelagius]|uniref:Glycosyltransferase, catalytic subunit of cellulose synthase and poly-beta-1,6-N-acetylglucosamine synthase n=1 Tax=Marinobacter pelagius TaxID=379482 RepID=A0A1I4T0M6_9GAMM|nr:glycosyltransferase family 2 protein [Marinobacter pelagius]SFM70209.1 Glycosyltransferase, catalytic subunit of cellulose synthase and poly-beta-1,6-N-acetylglucosamine synthase [Marinobacter pelagius]